MGLKCKLVHADDIDICSYLSKCSHQLSAGPLYTYHFQYVKVAYRSGQVGVFFPQTVTDRLHEISASESGHAKGVTTDHCRPL